MLTIFPKVKQFIRITYNVGQYYVHHNGCMLFSGTLKDVTRYIEREFPAHEIKWGW